MDAHSGDLGLATASPPLSSSSLLVSPSSAPPPPPAPLLPSSPYSPSSPSDTDRPPNPKRQTLTRKLSFPDDHLDPLLVARLNRWIVTFALVEFDIDSGPNLDNCYPPVRFPPSIKSNIAFSSLPEGDLPSLSPSSSSSLAETGYRYHWRIPYPSEGELREAEEEEERKGGGRRGMWRLPKRREEEDGGEDGDGALHGFVWFVQEKDPSLRRLYSQRSLVLITHLPSFPGLFSSALSIIAPLHFKHARQTGGGAKGGMVESGCYNIGAWPDPTPGSTLDLPLLGTVLTVSLPLPSQAQFPAPSPPPPSSFPPSPFLSSAAPARPPLALPASLPLTPLCVLLFPPYDGGGAAVGGKIGPVGFTKLLLLWELLVLGEPVLVFSNEPRVGAEAVEHLRRLIRPLPFAGDVRPYFHVHDRDFAKLCKPGGKPPPGLLLSSTNPLVLRNASKWPHVLNLSRSTTSSSSLSPSSAGASSSSTHPSSASSSPALSVSCLPAQANSLRANSGAVGGQGGALGGGAGGKKDDGKEFGLRSERKRHLRKDREVERRVEEAWGKGDYAAVDLLLYQHFASLTERFLSPLNRYFGTLWAGSGGLSLPSSSSSHNSTPTSASFLPHSSAPPLLSPGPAPLPSTRFSPSSFLTSLKTHGSSLPLKPSLSSSSFSLFGASAAGGSTSSVERFYKRFMGEGNGAYEGWLRERTRRVGGEVRRRYLERLEEAEAEGARHGGQGTGIETGVERLALDDSPSARTSPLPPPSTTLSPSSSPSPNPNPGLGIDTSLSHLRPSPSSGASSPSPSPSRSPASPALPLASFGVTRSSKQAERLRSLRDEGERTRSDVSSGYEGSTSGSEWGE